MKTTRATGGDLGYKKQSGGSVEGGGSGCGAERVSGTCFPGLGVEFCAIGESMPVFLCCGHGHYSSSEKCRLQLMDLKGVARKLEVKCLISGDYRGLRRHDRFTTGKGNIEVVPDFVHSYLRY